MIIPVISIAAIFYRFKKNGVKMNKDIKILLSRFRESGTNKSNNHLRNFLQN